VQHERDPFGGRERLEHHEQRQADRARERRLLGGVDGVRSGFGRPGRAEPDRLLAPGLSRSQHVEAHACGHGREPAAEVRDLARPGAVEPEPRLLHRVLSLARGTEHAVGEYLFGEARPGGVA
jgi:hypothetical protein